LDHDDTATLIFGLDGVAVSCVEPDADGSLVLVLVTACNAARSCPRCGQRSRRSLELVTIRPRDVPLAQRRTLLRWAKRRWACENTVCGRRSFTESLPSIPPRSRLTARLRASAGAAVADAGRTDETRRGKAKFRLVPGPDGADVWEVVADRWHVGFCDLTRGAGLLGQVEGHTAASVSEWIEQQSAAWRTGVKTVAIDMCTVFKAAVTASLICVARLDDTALTCADA
jgi:transposase